jgi:hypothetical protein
VLVLFGQHADAFLLAVPSRTIRSGRFPHWDLVSTNRGRGKQEMEYELLDTGIFDEDRYFDVVVEYAKGGPDDILMLVTAYKPRPGRGDAALAADAVVSQHVVVGR